ncbi:MAG: ABC transporter permease [Nitriliruptorales bacterium]|nr:ABC transporter permease [Nitriliruptorales bacterium]
MSPRTSAALLRHELRIMATDPSVVVFVLVMPLLMIAFTERLFAAPLASEAAGSQVDGSDFAVPGMAVAFAAFGVGFSGFAFFREHGWGTWERLRATPASPADIMTGKVLPAVLLTTLQVALLFALGGPLFGFTIRGSVLAITVLIVALALALNAFGVAIVAVTRTAQQLNAAGSAGGMVMATMGGAFVPIEVMPSWAATLAPAMPTYWAMRGLRAVIFEGGGIAETALPVLMLMGFTLAFGAVAAWRFRFDETKVHFG